MHIRTILLATLASAVLGSPALADIGLCQTRYVDGGQVVTGSTNPPGKAVPFDHTCGLASNFGCVSPSLSEQVSAPTYGPAPEVEQYRIGLVIDGEWLGTDWQDGSCSL